MHITVNAQDKFNCNGSQHDVTSKGEDNVNGRFSKLDWAKPFMSYGSLTRDVTWSRGSAGAKVSGGLGDKGTQASPGRGGPGGRLFADGRMHSWRCSR